MRSWKYIQKDFATVFEILKDHRNEYSSEIIWQTRHKFVSRIYLPEELGGGSIAYKFYKNVRPVRYFLRKSAACREACGFSIVHKLDIPAVKVLALGEKRIAGYLISSFFISQFADGYYQGAELLKENMSSSDRERLREFIQLNLGYLARLHREGYSHGGTHYKNFIWHLDEQGKMEVRWLDLATVRRLPPFFGKKKIRADLDMFLNCFGLEEQERNKYLEYYQKKYAGCR